MSQTSTPRSSSARDHSCRSERGAAVVVLLYGLSIFSVLSITLLKNAPLETTLRTVDNPDLHVLLYAGGAGSPKVLGRLNLPTVFRTRGLEPDASLEIRAPGPVGSALMTELEPGWAYAVQLSPELRVCCDGGDDACSSLPWDQQVPEGSLTTTMKRPLKITETKHELRFELSTFEVPRDVALDPQATTESAFMLKATRIPDGSSSREALEGATTVSCRLVGKDKILATGTLQLRPGQDERAQINRVSSGRMELNYHVPAK